MADGWLIVSWIGTALFSISLVPQGVRTFRRKSAYDVSVPFLLMVIAASVCMGSYMWISVDNPIAALGFIVNIVVWGMVLYYRWFPKVPESRTPAT